MKSLVRSRKREVGENLPMNRPTCEIAEPVSFLGKQEHRITVGLQVARVIFAQSLNNTSRHSAENDVTFPKGFCHNCTGSYDRVWT